MRQSANLFLNKYQKVAFWRFGAFAFSVAFWIFGVGALVAWRFGILGS
jgi:hypothetical protein